MFADETVDIPDNLTADTVAQCWYRFVHTIGNPCELCHPTLISQTESFLHYAIISETVVDPCHHPCLSQLPTNFYNAMRGVATIIDAFLGKCTMVVGGSL